MKKRNVILILTAFLSFFLGNYAGYLIKDIKFFEFLLLGIGIALMWYLGFKYRENFFK